MDNDKNDGCRSCVHYEGPYYLHFERKLVEEHCNPEKEKNWDSMYGYSWQTYNFDRNGTGDCEWYENKSDSESKAMAKELLDTMNKSHQQCFNLPTEKRPWYAKLVWWR